MEKTKDVRSNFVSPGGIAFLAILCILCTYFQIHSLSLFLFLILLIDILAYFWGHLALNKLQLSLTAASCQVFPGEDIRFSFSITNGKTLPLIWLTAELPRPAREFFQPEGGFLQRFAWLMPWQTLTIENAWKTERRGVYTPSTITISSGDGFGLSAFKKEMPLPDPPLFVVYPKVFPVNTAGMMSRSSDLRQDVHGWEEDVTLLKSTRSYQSGDNMKNINWRLLARQGELSVNLYEKVHPRQATFFLDLKSFTRWREEDTTNGKILVLSEFHETEMEEMISLTASCILALHRQKIGCALVLPGNREHPGKLLEATSEEHLIPELFTALAGIEYSGQDWQLPRETVIQSSYRLGQMFFITESPSQLTCQPLLDALEENRVCLISHTPAQKHPLYPVRDRISLRF